jgi:hypothetical protein
MTDNKIYIMIYYHIHDMLYNSMFVTYYMKVYYVIHLHISTM